MSSSSVISVLNISDLSLNDTDTYQCLAMNEHTSNSASFSGEDFEQFTLTVLSKLSPWHYDHYMDCLALFPGRPIFTLHPNPGDTIIAAGDEATLVCAVQGNPRPILSWRLNGEELPLNEPLLSVISSPLGAFSSQSELSIGPVTYAVTGVYHCSAQGVGTVSVISNTSTLLFTCKYCALHM